MLRLYIGENDKPKDLFFINDPDEVFPSVKITGSDFQMKVIKEIEHGTYYDDKRFTDRFGANVYYDCMSSGAKTLFVVECFKDKLVNCIDCGENALALLSCLKEGNVYLPYKEVGLPAVESNPIYCFGRVWNNIEELNTVLG